MKFFVTMDASATEDVAVEAENAAEAVKKARELRPTLVGSSTAQSVSESKNNGRYWEVLGDCEGCKAPILARCAEEVGGRSDEEGCWTCSACLAELDAP